MSLCLIKHDVSQCNELSIINVIESEKVVSEFSMIRVILRHR
jgi:hypothetical protein